MLLTSFFDLIVENIQKLTKRETFVLLMCILMMVIVINGIAFDPSENYLLLSQNPFATRTDIFEQNYWQESVLLPVMAFYTNLTTPYTFHSLCFVFFLIGYLLLAYLMVKHNSSVVALVFTTLVMTSPLTTALLWWLGTPDSLAFSLTVPFLFSNSVFLMFSGAVLSTLNHTVGIIAAGEILFLRWLSQDKTKIYHMISLIIGGVVGYVLVRVFLKVNDIELMTSRLDFILSRSLILWIRMNAQNFPLSIFSLFNVHWVIIFASIIMFFKTDKVYYSSLIVILLLNSVITFFTEDTTRVFSLLSWGILLECMSHSYKLSLEQDEKGVSYSRQYLFALVAVALVSFISLRYYSYGGGTYPATPIHEFFRQFVSYS